jgi:hypothetical protein
MFDRILKRIRERIRSRQYVLTIHAEEEMEDDGLTILDVERILLTGRVIERQKDRDSRERKYLVRGHTYQPKDGVAVVKFGPTGKLVSTPSENVRF